MSKLPTFTGKAEQQWFTVQSGILTSTSRVIARVHPVHAMNAEQRQLAVDPWTKLID